MSSKSYKGFIFDLNGTMVDDMSYHGDAWYEVLVTRLGATLTREQVKHQMYGRNDELLKRVFGDSRFTSEQIEEYGLVKEHIYQEQYKPEMKLIAGLDHFLREAHSKNLLLAIGSAALPLNIDFVLDTLAIRPYFSAIVSALDVRHSKPDPETYLMAARNLSLEPESCLVFEDAPKGVECAQNAGMDCIVLTTTHPPSDFKAYSNILFFAKDYSESPFGELIQK